MNFPNESGEPEGAFVRVRFLRILPVCTLIFACCVPVAAQSGGGPTLESNTPRSTDGTFQLIWDAGGTDVVLEEVGPDADLGRVIYEGSDESRVISGLPDGEYRYRVRHALEPEAWSEPVVVTVEHHHIGKALAFFSLGALVFVSTIALIAWGAIRDARDGGRDAA